MCPQDDDGQERYEKGKRRERDTSSVKIIKEQIVSTYVYK